MVTGSATMSVRRLLQKTVHPRVEIYGFSGAVELPESGPRSSWPGFAALGIFRTVTRAAD
jgi:hypothetical protein